MKCIKERVFVSEGATHTHTLTTGAISINEYEQSTHTHSRRMNVNYMVETYANVRSDQSEHAQKRRQKKSKKKTDTQSPFDSKQRKCRLKIYGIQLDTLSKSASYCCCTRTKYGFIIATRTNVRVDNNDYNDKTAHKPFNIEYVVDAIRIKTNPQAIFFSIVRIVFFFF